MDNIEYEEEEEEEEECSTFFTKLTFHSIVENISFVDEIFNLSLRLGMSHDVTVQYKEMYTDRYKYGMAILELWRETNDKGNFESCRILEANLKDMDLCALASRLVNMFIIWSDKNICCRKRVEAHAKCIFRRFNKKDCALMTNVRNMYDQWSDDLCLDKNEIFMALYLQLYGLQLFKCESQHSAPVVVDAFFHINESLSHHLPRDAFFSPFRYTNVTGCIVNKNTFMLKQIYIFLHEKKLMQIATNLTDMDTVSKLAVNLSVSMKQLEAIIHRHRHSFILTAYFMLYTWRFNCSFLKEGKIVSDMIKALQKIGYYQLASEIEEDYTSWQQTPRCTLLICRRPPGRKRKCIDCTETSLPILNDINRRAIKLS